MAIVTLSPKDISVLNQIISEFRNRPINPVNRGKGPYIPQSPEVYVALPPSGGIPALTGDGKTFGDTPGSAYCTIFKLIAGKVQPISGFQRLVYNLSKSAITQSWIQVIRDKAGSWFAVTGGGGCTPQDAIIDITLLGSPTGGTFTLTWFVLSTSVVTTHSFNDNAAAVKAQLETIPAVAAYTGTGPGNVAVSNGPFPNATMRVEFQNGLGNQNIILPTANFAALTGGTGVGIICSLAQLGSP